MIGRVLPRGGNVRGVLHYLYGKGKRNQHVNPRLVAGWIHPADLEPPRRPGLGTYRAQVSPLEQMGYSVRGRCRQTVSARCRSREPGRS